jgi:hypothetical protein
MTSYLLLRNNKESGPYSLEDLVSLGLKAYDLVWVKGKSAAWRYPGEIPELQEWAPAVEEQPYDRFFKKPSETKPALQESKTAATREELPAAKIQAPVQPTQPVFTPKKSVFVTLPNQKQQVSPLEKPQSNPNESYQDESYQQYQPGKKADPVYEEPSLPEQTITIKENPVAAEIKYSQPLDEIKEMYVKTLQDRRQRIATKNFLIQAMKKVAIILAIVGAGVVIGFTLKSRTGNKPVIAGESVSPSKEAITPTDTETTITNNQPLVPQNEEAPQPAEGSIITGNSFAENNKNLQSYKSPAVSENVYEQQLAAKAPPKEKEITRKEINLEDETTPGLTVDSRTGERSRKLRTPADKETTEDFNEPVVEEKTEPGKRVNQPKAVMGSKSLTKQVSVKSNDYKIVAFGGIRDLQLTVYNDSKYILDNVTVELQYFKPSMEILKSETLQFRSVSPNGSLTLRVPDTNRGVKVSYKITNILSIQSAKELADL